MSSEPSASPRFPVAAFYFLAGLITVSDQLVKAVVRARIPLESAIPVWPGVFQLRHVENDGIAFSFLAGQRWLILVASLLIMAGIVATERRAKGGLDRFTGLALALPLGGALGNLLDRVIRGVVTDFLDFNLIHFPVFNVADSAITIGIVFLAWRSLTAPAPKPTTPSAVVMEDP